MKKIKEFLYKYWYAVIVALVFVVAIVTNGKGFV